MEHLPFTALFSCPPSTCKPSSAFKRKPVHALGIFQSLHVKRGKMWKDFLVDPSWLRQPQVSADMWWLAWLSGWGKICVANSEYWSAVQEIWVGQRCVTQQRAGFVNTDMHSFTVSTKRKWKRGLSQDWIMTGNLAFIVSLVGVGRKWNERRKLGEEITFHFSHERSKGFYPLSMLTRFTPARFLGVLAVVKDEARF